MLRVFRRADTGLLFLHHHRSHEAHRGYLLLVFYPHRNFLAPGAGYADLHYRGGARNRRRISLHGAWALGLFVSLFRIGRVAYFTAPSLGPEWSYHRQGRTDLGGQGRHS